MDVIHFKIRIQKKLEDYELFVEEEANRELVPESPVDTPSTEEQATATYGADEDVEMSTMDN
jgi:hypothetical protein